MFRDASANIPTPDMRLIQSSFAILLQTLCFRGKCSLTCLYGRVEVMGFTIEEGQESYPLFSPASHCPLIIRSLEASYNVRNAKTVASTILPEYLPVCK